MEIPAKTRHALHARHVSDLVLVVVEKYDANSSDSYINQVHAINTSGSQDEISCRVYLTINTMSPRAEQKAGVLMSCFVSDILRSVQRRLSD